MNDQKNPQDLDASRPGMRRRAILSGAAWSVPVVALSSAAPATAASTQEPTLSFDQQSYTVDGCGDLEDVVVTGTTNGQEPAPAGSEFVITLPEGFTFADGSTSPLTLEADAAGQVTLPAITAPASATDAEITAQWGDVTTTAELTVSALAGGTDLYIGYSAWNPDFQPVTKAGLPDGYSFRSITASDGAIYATLGDGRVFTARELNFTGSLSVTRTWYDTGLTGDVHDMIISSSDRSGNSLVLHDGQLTSFVANPDTTASHKPVARALASPPGTVVDIAATNGVGSYYAETSDGKLWVTPFSGTQRGTWTQITGFPGPVKDWVVNPGNASELLAVIGSDGGFYSHPVSTGIRPSVLSNWRNPLATWTAPLEKFSKPHQARDGLFQQDTISFVDANGNFFSYEGGQNVNLAGVLSGRLKDLDPILTADAVGSSTGNFAHVVTDGKLYVADFFSNVPFRDVTPPASLLDGETIVDAHQTAFQIIFAIGSGGTVFTSNRLVNGSTQPTWQIASGLPESASSESIIQDGRHTYMLAESQECPA